MPFGHRRIEVGLMLRDAMFVNGILTNSEAWHSISDQNIEDLEVMDRMLLRYILGAHSKIQTEFLYLETGATPLKQVITSRRLMYLQTLLKRPSTEITKQVYEAQKLNPTKGDWVEHLNKDFDMLDMAMNEDNIKDMSKAQHKSEVRKKVKLYVLGMLKNKQEGHSKIRHIKYHKLNMQPYLKSTMFNNHEASLLISLRSRTTREFKANFPFNNDQMCPMGCAELDTPEHCLKCDKIYPKESRDLNIQYEDIFSDSVYRQADVTKLFATLLEKREDASATDTGPSLHPAEGDDSS